jgi:hypothetical protein
VLRRAAQVLAICGVVGCGEPVQLDLFAPDPRVPDDAQAEALPTGERRDAGHRTSSSLATDAQVVEVPPQPAPAIELDDAAGPLLPSLPEAGVGESAAGDAGAPEVRLILRYDFSGSSGTELVDRVSAKPARALGGAALDGSGTLSLDGVDDYVDLPEGTLVSLDSVTVVTWLVLRQGGCRQPVFGFGEREAGPDVADDDGEHAALSVSLSSCPTADAGVDPPPASLTTGSVAIRHDHAFQLALSYDANRSQKTLYVNGVRISEGPIHYALSDLGEHAWLGRVHWKQDYFARGSYDEFRVYDGVLSESQIVNLYERGPDRP